VAAAARRQWQGRTYDSLAEMRYAIELDALVDGEAIVDIVEQPSVKLGTDPACRYRPDFLIVQDGYFVDVKGQETADFRRNVKLWRQYARLPLHVIKVKGDSFYTAAVVEPSTLSGESH
jgi:hypothetical protein